MLDDGTYDVLVVDVDEVDGHEGAIRIEVTLLAGPRKGEVLAITATGIGRDPLELLAAPGTLTVADGVPSLALEG